MAILTSELKTLCQDRRHTTSSTPADNFWMSDDYNLMLLCNNVHCTSTFKLSVTYCIFCTKQTCVSDRLRLGIWPLVTITGRLATPTALARRRFHERCIDSSTRSTITCIRASSTGRMILIKFVASRMSFYRNEECLACSAASTAV